MNNKATDQDRKDLEQDLASVYSKAEAEDLLKFSDHIRSLYVPPARSTSAKRAGWEVIEEAMNSGDRKSFWTMFAKIAAVPALLLVVLLGAVFMSQTALPGDPGYAVKRAGESVQLAVTFSPQRKADMCSMLMKRRANELGKLSQRQLSTQTVASLTSAIHEEADEYARYAAASGGSESSLDVQRMRDAKYVAEALQHIDMRKQTPENRQAIQQTIESMQAIAKSA